MEPTTLTTESTLDDLIVLGDWSLIVATCHWNGSHKSVLTGSMLQVARAQADGFGDLRGLRARIQSGEQVSADERSLYEQVIVEGDWSHFRDSTEEGQERVARFVRTMILGKIREGFTK